MDRKPLREMILPVFVFLVSYELPFKYIYPQNCNCACQIIYPRICRVPVEFWAFILHEDK